MRDHHADQSVGRQTGVHVSNISWPVAKQVCLRSWFCLSPFSAVQGLTPAIEQVVQGPFQIAFSNAASTVFLVSLAFSGTAVILAFLTTNNDGSTEDCVVGNVHGTRDEKEWKQEKRHASQTDEPVEIKAS